MKEKIKSFDKHVLGGRLSKCYRQSKSFFKIWISGYPQILKIRLTLIRRLGLSTYFKIRELNVVSFPNELEQKYSLDLGGYSIEKVFAVCGIRVKQFNPWKKSDLILNWQVLTNDEINAENYIETSYQCVPHESSRPWRDDLNFKCDDISKVKVGKVHKEVMGYELDIDPIKFNGLAVCKSNENATHDGVIINCPIKSEDKMPDKVYSILVETSDGQYTTDFRLYYIRGLLDYFLEIKKPIEWRFGYGGSMKRGLRNIREEFSPLEIDAIEDFCKKMNADYGELDVMRDAETKRVYIVDFAKTAVGIPPSLPRELRMKLLGEMSFAFCQRILVPLCKS
jgi:hypothetical protein